MPPRHSYWTILIDGQPTAFRAAEPDELLPTFNRLKGKHADTVMKWFERGRLWDSREAARETTPRGPRESRGKGWRPGGEHRDPREKYELAKKAKWKRYKDKIRERHEDRRSKPGAEGGRPPGRRDFSPDDRPRDDRPREKRPWNPRPGKEGERRFDRPREGRPPFDHDREGRPTSRPKVDERRGKSGGGWGAPQNRAGGPPKKWGKPPGQSKQDGRSEWKRDVKTRPQGRKDRPWNDRPREERPRDDRRQSDRPWSDRPAPDRPNDRPRDTRFRDQRFRGEPHREDRSRDDRPRGERSRDEGPRGDRPREERSRGDRQWSDRPPGSKGPKGFRPGERGPQGKKPWGDRRDRPPGGFGGKARGGPPRGPGRGPRKPPKPRGGR